MISLGVLTYPAGIADFDRNEPFSVEVWFYATAARQAMYISKMGPAPDYRGWGIIVSGGRTSINGAGFYLVNTNVAPGNYISLAAATPAWARPINTWNHLVFTYSGSGQASGVKCYLNGVLKGLIVAGNSLTGTIKNSAKFKVGTGPLYPWFPGRLDEVVIYNRVLAQAEVTQRYNAGAGTETLFGAAYLQYKMNEASGTVVNDSSGNLRNGVTVGSPSWVAGKLNNCISLNGSSQYVEA